MKRNSDSAILLTPHSALNHAGIGIPKSRTVTKRKQPLINR